MYRTLSLEQLLSTKTEFLTNLRKVFTRERYPSFKHYLRDQWKQGDDVYYFFRGTPQFRLQRQADESILLTDERERIQLHATTADIDQLHRLLKTEKNIQRTTKNTLSTEKQLLESVKNGELTSINGRDYLVYDIETTYATKDLSKTEFLMAYAYVMRDGTGTYKYIDSSNLRQFVDFMREFDGYVVGFNSIGFDNPVSVYNALAVGSDDEQAQAIIEEINTKSLDIFLFLAHLTGKKIGLNKIATALVGLSKTLESGAQAEVLMKQYEETGDVSYLKECKKYCKNDVKMTLLVLLYLLKFDHIAMEGEEYSYDHTILCQYGQTLLKDNADAVTVEMERIL